MNGEEEESVYLTELMTNMYMSNKENCCQETNTKKCKQDQAFKKFVTLIKTETFVALYQHVSHSKVQYGPF